MNASPETVVLAGEVALGLAHEDQRFERDPAFRAAVVNWQRHFAALDATALRLTPTPALWSRLEAAVLAQHAGARQGKTIAGPGAFRDAWARLWGNLAIWRPAAFAGAFASLVFAVLLTSRIAGGPEVPQLVAVLAAPDGRAAAVVNAYADGTVQLVPLDAIAVPEGRVLEVWTLQTRERGPVSLARMDKARTIKLELKGLSAAEVGHLFEITLEPAGGSPTGKPTGPVLMKGLAVIRL